MSGIHSLSSQSPPLGMDKHRYGNAKVFYDNEGRIYYQGKQNNNNQSPGRAYPPPAHSEPLPDSRDYRSYDPERDRNRKHQYEESFRSLDHDADIGRFRQKGYQVVSEEVYDPYTGKPTHINGSRHPPHDVSPDRRRRRDFSPPRSPENRPLPMPPQNQYHDKGSWQRSFDRHPLVDERYDQPNTNSGYKCLGSLYILTGILMISVGIVNVLLCGEYHYYFRFWTGVLVLLAGIFGVVHGGDYATAWKTWCYVIFATIGTLSAFVGFAFLVRMLSPQTVVISFTSSLSTYAIFAMPSDPHVTVSDKSVTWVCYAMDWLSLVCLLVAFTLMSSAIVIFNKFWAENYTSTNDVEPFCRPQLFNPWGQVQLGQAIVFIGVITVYTCTAVPADTDWAKYWSPVWAGGLAMIAGWVSGIAGKREDILEASLSAVLLQTVSLCTSVAAIVLCTLGMVDNINTAQDLYNETVAQSTELRDLTVASAVFFAIADGILLVNVFYTIGGMVRHLSSFCNGIRARNKKRLTHNGSANLPSGFPGQRHAAPQHSDRGPARYGEYPSYDRNMSNGYPYPQRY